MIAALFVGALCLVVSSSYVLYETDFWQHLVMGRAIWEGGGIPRAHSWTWPQHGEPYFLSSWGFRAVVWPLWSWGGIGALYAWRWTTTLAVFGLLFAIARAMGARGFLPVLVLVWYSLDYRLRSDIRPETLAAPLFALQLWILERRRLEAPASGRDATWWIVPIAWVWANVHISYYLGFLLTGLYLAESLVRGRGSGPEGREARRRATQLAWVTGAALAASFANPFGATALWQPFAFALSWRHDPLVKTIGELQPMTLKLAWENGLALWPALILLRVRRRLDWVEILGCAFFTALALSSMRFVATYAVMAAPFVARDLHEVAGRRRWPVPRAPFAVRGALTALLSVILCLSDWLRPDLPLGIGLDPTTYPERACDFMAAHGVRGRGFNHSHHGGYLAFRFWPDRERLPFISTQPEYARAEDRRLYLAALTSPAGWREIDARYRFDYVLLQREQSSGDVLLETLDQDPAWAMVFADDAAELLVRRDGAFAGLADPFGYRVVPAGRAGRTRLVGACERDPELRARAAAELDRQIAGSPHNGSASHLRGWLAMMDGDLTTARGHLERAVALKPLLPYVHDMLGIVAVAEGRPREAIRRFDLERRLHEPPPGIFFRTGVAYRLLGDTGRARRFYERELRRDPGHPGARDSLAALRPR